MSDNRATLREHFRFVLSDASTLDVLLNKDEFYELAKKLDLVVPKTYCASDIGQVGGVSQHVTFPCVIKPRYSPSWQSEVAKAIGHLKILECKSPGELLSRDGSLPTRARDVVIQEMIPGNEDRLHDVYVYLGLGDSSLGSFCLQKLRTAPIAGRGGGTLVQSTHNSVLAATTMSFMQAIGYRGPAAVCFKQHAETGQFVAIEVNARLSLHHSLAAHCGIDYAYLLYCDSIGPIKNTPISSYPAGVKWIAALGDARALRDYRREYGLSIRKWFQSYRGRKTFADWSWRDPWPFARECTVLLPSVVRKIWFRTRKVVLLLGCDRDSRAS